MTRRSVTTLTVSVALRIPPGSNAKEVLGYITSALRANKPLTLNAPLASLDTDSMIVKIINRETTYL